MGQSVRAKLLKLAILCLSATGVDSPAATTGQARPGLKQKERFEFSAQKHLLAVNGCMQIGSLPALQR